MESRADSFYPIDKRQEINNAGIRVSTYAFRELMI